MNQNFEHSTYTIEIIQKIFSREVYVSLQDKKLKFLIQINVCWC